MSLEQHSSKLSDRARRAVELGLPESTSWDEIFAHVDEHERRLLTQELGLPTYPEAREYGYSEYPSWRYILTAALDLDHTASIEEILSQVRSNKKSDGSMRP